MALAFTNIVDVYGDTVATKAVGSQTWTTGSLFLALVFQRNNSGDAPAAATCTDWDSIGTDTNVEDAACKARLSVFEMIGDGDTQDYTFDLNATNDVVHIHIVEITGQSASPIVQVVTNTSSDHPGEWDVLTATLASFADATNNAAYCAAAASNGTAMTLEDGWTSLASRAYGNATLSSYFIGEDTTCVANSPEVTPMIVVGVEVAVLAAAGIPAGVQSRSGIHGMLRGLLRGVACLLSLLL